MNRLLCWLGFHKIDEFDGWDQYDYNENYIETIFYCKKCDKRITKKL